MADIPGVFSKVQTESVEFNSPVSEALNTQYGENINKAQDDITSQDARITSLEADNTDVSAGSSTFSTTSGTFVDVTNLSTTLTTNGRAVDIKLLTDKTSSPLLSSGILSSVGGEGEIQILRDAVVIAIWKVQSSNPAATFAMVDDVAAGTYTWKVQMRITTASSMQAFEVKMSSAEY